MVQHSIIFAAELNITTDMKDDKSLVMKANWQAGHSGEYLSEEDAEKLDELWEKYMK